MESEAELAAVLGHEIGHVDRRHAIERWQYEAKLRKFSLEDIGQLGDQARRPLEITYDATEETEADDYGVALATRAGYEPEAAARLMRRLLALAPQPAEPKPRTPAGEAARAVRQTLGDWLSTHPRTEERVRHLERAAGGGTTVSYRGEENFRRRIPRSRLNLSSELVGARAKRAPNGIR